MNRWSRRPCIRMHKILWGVLLASLPFAIFYFFFHAAGQRSVWLDEAFSLHAAQQSLTGMVDCLKNDNGPPLYYGLLSIWIRIFGESEAAARALSGLFSVLAACALYTLTRTLFNRRAGQIGFLLFLCAPIVLRNAQNIRMYALLGLLSVVSLSLFYRMLFQENRTRRAAALFILANVLGLLTHYSFLLVPLAQLLTVLAVFRRLAIRMALFHAVSAVFFTLAWLPVLLVQIRSGNSEWIIKPSPMELLYTFNPFMMTTPQWTAFLCFLAIGAGGGYLSRHAVGRLVAGSSYRTTLLYMALLILPAFLISRFFPLYAAGKTTVLFTAPFILLAAPLIGLNSRRWMQWLLCAALLGMTIKNVYEYRHQSPTLSDMESARTLVENAGAHDMVIFTSLSRLSVDYYVRRYGPDRKYQEIVYPAVLGEHPGWRNNQAMLDDLPGLQQEADTVLAEATAWLSGDTSRSVWLFYGYDTQVSGILRSRLNNNLRLSETIPAPGYFHKSMVRYRLPAPPKRDSE